MLSGELPDETEKVSLTLEPPIMLLCNECSSGTLELFTRELLKSSFSGLPRWLIKCGRCSVLFEVEIDTDSEL